MYTNFTKMIKYFFPPSVCLEKIKMLQIYVKIARHAASGRIPVFHCSNQLCYKGVFHKHEGTFILFFLVHDPQDQVM